MLEARVAALQFHVLSVRVGDLLDQDFVARRLEEE
jgi:hypothetical protein